MWPIEAAFALDQPATAGELLASVERLKPGIRRLGIVFWLAVSELEGAELLLESEPGSDEAQAWLAEAAEIFGRLGAKPWLDRLASVAQRADPALDPSV